MTSASEGHQPEQMSASGVRSAAVGRDVSGVVTTGDHSPVTQVSLGPLRPIGEVPPTAGPVGVPGVGVFVGRVDELARLHGALHGESTVVVQAVAGLGGIGKSTLAARYVLEHATQYTQVLWLTADSGASVEAGLASFAVALEPQLARALSWLAAIYARLAGSFTPS